LNPRKVNTLHPKLALELGVSGELISDVVSFYWKEIKKALEEPEHITICIEDFGTFEIRKKQIEYQIEKYKRQIKYMKPTTYTKHVLLNIAANKLSRFEKLLTMCVAQEEKKKQVREIQKNGKTV
jgi:nucleoid DNA-binding protein